LQVGPTSAAIPGPTNADTDTSVCTTNFTMHSDCDPETSLSSIEVWRNLDGIPTIIFVFDDGRRQRDGSPNRH
jgi:hypothetical protein